MRRLALNFLLLLLTSGSPLAAEPKVVELRVVGMNCALCPLTIRKALAAAPGVIEAHIEYETKRARIKFDPAKATPESLARLVTEAGYPAKVEKR